MGFDKLCRGKTVNIEEGSIIGSTNCVDFFTPADLSRWNRPVALGPGSYKPLEEEKSLQKVVIFLGEKLKINM